MEEDNYITIPENMRITKEFLKFIGSGGRELNHGNRKIRINYQKSIVNSIYVGIDYTLEGDTKKYEIAIYNGIMSALFVEDSAYVPCDFVLDMLSNIF